MAKEKRKEFVGLSVFLLVFFWLQSGCGTEVGNGYDIFGDDQPKSRERGEPRNDPVDNQAPLPEAPGSTTGGSEMDGPVLESESLILVTSLSSFKHQYLFAECASLFGSFSIESPLELKREGTEEIKIKAVATEKYWEYTEFVEEESYVVHLYPHEDHKVVVMGANATPLVTGWQCSTILDIQTITSEDLVPGISAKVELEKDSRSVKLEWIAWEAVADQPLKLEKVVITEDVDGEEVVTVLER